MRQAAVAAVAKPPVPRIGKGRLNQASIGEHVPCVMSVMETSSRQIMSCPPSLKVEVFKKELGSCRRLSPDSVLRED